MNELFTVPENWDNCYWPPRVSKVNWIIAKERKSENLYPQCKICQAMRMRLMWHSRPVQIDGRKERQATPSKSNDNLAIAWSEWSESAYAFSKRLAITHKELK